MANVTLSALARLLEPSSNIDPTAAAMAQLSAQLGNQPREPMAETYGGWVQANPGVMGNAMGDVGSAISGALSQFASMRQRDRMKAERQNITSKDQIDPRDLVNAEDPELRAIGGKMLASKALTQQEKKDLVDQNLGVPFKAFDPVTKKLVYYNAQRFGPPKATDLEAPVELMAQNLGDRYDIRPRVGGVEGYRDERLIAPPPVAPDYREDTGQVVDRNVLFNNSPSGQAIQQERQQNQTGLRGFNRKAAEYFGVPPALADEIVTRESGWKPDAVNNWDSNAKKGTPSAGVSQFIEPTFNKFYDEMAQEHGDLLSTLGPKNWNDPKQQLAVMNWALANGRGGHWSTFGSAKKAAGVDGWTGASNPSKTQVQPPQLPSEVPTPDSPLGQRNNIPGITKVAPSKQERTMAAESEDLLSKHAEYVNNLNRLAELSGTIQWDAGIPGVGKGTLARMAKDTYERSFGRGDADARNEFKRLSEAVVGPNLKALTGGGQIAIPEQLMARMAIGLQPEMGGANLQKSIQDKLRAAKELEALLRSRAGKAPTGPAPTAAPTGEPVSELDAFLKQNGF